MTRLPLYAGTFLVAGAILLLEVALTRVFAVLMWHHFAYMVVSLALVGFGAAGSILAARGTPREPGVLLGRLAACSCACGVAVILAFMAATSIRVHSLEIWKEPLNFLGLAAIFAILAVPFLLAGLAIGLAIAGFADRVGRVYAADLCGSAVGAGSAPWIMESIGATAAVVLAGTAAMLAALLFAMGTGARRRLAFGAVALAGLLLLTAFCGGGAGIPALEWKLPFAPHKGIGALFPGMKPERTIHSSVAQIDVGPPMTSGMFIGGQFGDRDIQEVVIRGVTQDGTAPSAMYRNASSWADMHALDDTQAASAFVALRARGSTHPRVLVIGVGGGPDVMMALYNGSRDVTAVEINRAMIRMVTDDYGDFMGGLFDDPRVRLEHEDGRSFARRDSTTYDVIQMSGVDTYTALSTGAYTLSESYLYTVEAVKDFWARLNTGGIINYSRFLLQAPKRPRETIRLANVARTALEELGVEQPWRHILVLQAHGWASTMIRKGPFTDQEVGALRRFADDEHFMGLVADPSRARGGPYAPGRWADARYRKAAQEALAAAARALGLEGTPLGAGVEAEVEQALRHATRRDAARSDDVLDALLRRLPGTASDRVGRALRASRDSFAGEFREASEHFIRVQRDFEILLRSSDRERRDFIERYFYDLTPPTDDRPFFFNYFRWDHLLQFEGSSSWDATYHPDFPVGHMVLISSIAQIAVLAAVLIFLPLRRLRRRGSSTGRQRLRIFTYFLALGMGFMFVEICLMQKFVLFLGHPAWAVSVVLAGILFFSGLGALLSQRLPLPDRRTRLRLLLGVSLAVLFEMLAANLLLDRMLGLPFTLRVCATIALLAPLGLALGLPFPLGVRLLDRHAPELVPWAWAINGFLSVLSSLLAIVLAMVVGFNAVLLLGAAVYALGLIQLPFFDEAPATPHDSKTRVPGS